MLEFYHHRTSCCAVKSRLCLNEKGLAYDGHILDLRAGDQFSPDYLKLNPNALVPTLVHDGKAVVESTVINEYLDDAFPDPPLKPADAAGRARMRLWTKKPDEGGHAACGAFGFALSHRHLIADTSPAAIEAHLARVQDPSQRERQRQSILHGLEAPQVIAAARTWHRTIGEMETALTDAPWLAGDSYSLADIALTPYITRLDAMGMAALWQGTRPRVGDWYARIGERPSHRRTIFEEGDTEVFRLLAENSRREAAKIEALLAAVSGPG